MMAMVLCNVIFVLSVFFTHLRKKQTKSFFKREIKFAERTERTDGWDENLAIFVCDAWTKLRAKFNQRERTINLCVLFLFI